MDRLTLSNLHEQLDSLKSTSLPQVKRYFRKRIEKCINECKLQASNMKKTTEPAKNRENTFLEQNEYDFGWGSDFDDSDDEDEENQVKIDLFPNSQCYSSSEQNRTSHSSLVNLNESILTDDIRSLNLKPQLLNNRQPPHDSANQRSPVLSSSLINLKICPSETPPPLPLHPPPHIIEQRDHVSSLKRETSFEGTYEVMSPPSDPDCDNEYLLPNSPVQLTVDKYSGNIDRKIDSNYEYIQYNKFDKHLTYSSDSGSLASSSSRSNLRLDGEVISERPLPPIPGVNIEDEFDLNIFPWFHEIERDVAERTLLELAIDGAYLVRKSRRAGLCNPFTLTIHYNRRIFHLNIRKRSDNLFALGKEKNKEKTFSTVMELIEYHKSEPIFLTSKGLASGKIKLLYTPSK